MTRSLAAVFAVGLLVAQPVAAAVVQPLERAHAHNDYEHDRPLFDALDQGFTSVEADIWNINGQLLVAHDFWDLDPSRTLQSLYLDPLRALVQANGGSVHAEASRFNLLIDVKTGAQDTWAVLKDVLAGYSDILTTFGEGGAQGAVTAIVSGNRAREEIFAGVARLAGYDGRSSDLGGAAAEYIPLISDNWGNLFTWRGEGEFSAAEQALLANIVETAHGNGQIVRFWNTPDNPVLWQTLIDFNVDLINTDDLAGLSTYLRENDPQERVAVPEPMGMLLLATSLGLLAVFRRPTA